jgi:hypothetical protein
VPLGLATIMFWTRKKSKETNALKRKVNPTRVGAPRGMGWLSFVARWLLERSGITTAAAAALVFLLLAWRPLERLIAES